MALFMSHLRLCPKPSSVQRALFEGASVLSQAFKPLVPITNHARQSQALPLNQIPSTHCGGVPKALKVVVVGPSQSGKSTFLALLHDMFGKGKPASLQTGSGNESTTVEPATYRLLAKQLDYSPFLKVEASRNGMTHEEFIEAFCERTDYEADVKLIADADAFDLEMIDTPGFDDSTANKDEEHGYNILKKLHGLESVHAFIFVLGKGIHYGGAFQRVFLHYWNTFDGFRDRFILVHTKWDPTDDEFEEAKANRIAAFERTFSGTGHLEHFFIECKWGSSKRQRPQHKKAFAARSINQILSALAVCEPQPTAKLAYLKTPHMKQIDAKLIGFVKGRLAGATEALENVKSVHAELNKYCSDRSAEYNEKMTRLKGVDERLNDINHKDLVEDDRSPVDHPGYYFHESSTEVEVNAHPCTVRAYKTTISTKYTKWTDIKMNGTILTGTIKSEWWAGHSGSLIALVYSCDKHDSEITKLMREQSNLQNSIQLLAHDLEVKSKQRDGANEEWLRLQATSTFAGKCIGHLQRERMPLEEYFKVRALYQRSVDGDDSSLFKEYCKAVWPEEEHFRSR